MNTKRFLSGFTVLLVIALSRSAWAPPPPPQSIQLSAVSYTVAENGVSASITITRTSSNLARIANVDFRTSNGTATAGSDYTAVALTAATGTAVHFASGESSKTATIPILDDSLVEGDETLNLTLSNPTGQAVSLGSPSTAVLTIIDNDFPPPVCGNGILEAGEQCDDGNTANGDCCDSSCHFEPAGSACNDSNVCTATDTCDGAGLCTGAGSTCGNGILDAICGEQCDDSNTTSGDGCSSTCQIEFCGDASINNNGTEQCDNGVANSNTVADACRTNCQLARCGDSVIDTGEQCDDGNTVSGDGCSRTCQLEFCGDGLVNNGGTEQCDDGNTANGDCCDSTCHFEPAGSACNDSNVCTATDTCDGAGLCTGAGSTCGNGIPDAICGEQCDDGGTLSGDGCSSICQIEFCGDGSVNNAGAEQCDDGNTVNGDGCSSTCQLETPPPPPPPPPPPVCGNGSVEAGEQCDDGNTLSGDGCDSNCQLEAPATAPAPSSSPATACGNGVVEGTEECDDGNTVDGDGCSSTCVKEVAASESPSGGGTDNSPPAEDVGGDGGGCQIVNHESASAGINLISVGLLIVPWVFFRVRFRKS